MARFLTKIEVKPDGLGGVVKLTYRADSIERRSATTIYGDQIPYMAPGWHDEHKEIKCGTIDEMNETVEFYNSEMDRQNRLAAVPGAAPG